MQLFRRACRPNATRILTNIPKPSRIPHIRHGSTQQPPFPYPSSRSAFSAPQPAPSAEEAIEHTVLEASRLSKSRHHSKQQHPSSSALSPSAKTSNGMEKIAAFFAKPSAPHRRRLYIRAEARQAEWLARILDPSRMSQPPHELSSAEEFIKNFVSSDITSTSSEPPSQEKEEEESTPPLYPLRDLPHPARLLGKRVLVTGASSGIGKAIALRFAEEGARIILVGRRQDVLEQMAEAMKRYSGEGGEEEQVQGHGKGHRVVVGDVSERELWEGFGTERNIDILVNCAGWSVSGPLLANPLDAMEKVLDTNLLGTMMGCKAIGKHMLKRKEGCIINVASLLGVKGGKGAAAYAASKAGVIALTRALAAEMGAHNVRVNVLVPGYVETAMTHAMNPKTRTAAMDAIPLKRFGLASEIADAAVFLATNKYANNCVLNIDGGLSAT